MEEQKRKPGRPRKWSSDAERMRATRAAQRAEREATAEPAKKRSHGSDGRGDDVPTPSAAASQTPPSAVVPEPSADHADSVATIGVLRRELVDLEERYDDLVLSRWMLSRKHEHALGRMRSHDPEGINWLVEQLADWERDVEAKRTKRLQEPNRERVRRRYEEEFDRRLELARRESKQ